MIAAVVLDGCTRPPPPARPPRPAPSRFTLECHGPRQALLGTGDRLQFTLGVLRGERGEWTCGVVDPGAVRWASSDSTVAVVSTLGEVHARIPGRTTIEAAFGGEVTRRELRVLPPVHSIVWWPRDTSVIVGDTVRLQAIARDSAGVSLERLLPLAVGPLEEHAGEVVFDPTGGTLIRGVRPGRLLLVAELAHRRDTAVVVVRPRP